MTDGAGNDPRFREITRERVSERVAQEIMSLIAAGTLTPGERLPGERQLAEMMNVSRVSVRTALQDLKSQGFIVSVQGGGTRVAAPSAKADSPLMSLVRADARNLQDLAEIRAHIETWGVRRAAERASPDQVAEMEATVTRMADPERAAGDKSADDVAFHMAIAHASGSPVYRYVMDMLERVLERNIAFTRQALCFDPEEERQLLSEHRAILAAVRRGDPDAAEQAMGRHLQHVVRCYIRSEDRSESPAPAGGGKVRETTPGDAAE